MDAVDCQSGTVTLDSSGNLETIYASDTTEVTVESSTVPFCSLDGYVGAPADVWVLPYGSVLDKSTEFWRNPHGMRLL